jgi:3-oxoacyl-[acyl-carrier protein] reductase
MAPYLSINRDGKKPMSTLLKGELMHNFTDMVAVVVGGADNIGRATAVMLARGGARVVIGYHSNASGAEQGVSMIRQAGGEAIAVQLDHSKEE